MKKSLYLFLSVFCLLIVNLVKAQDQLPTPRNIRTTYENGTRSLDGSPGKNYWQNSADYNLDIHFFPSTRLLSGTVAIHYVNNSPDTLRQVWFKLNPNYYKKGVARNRSIDEADAGDGLLIDQFFVNGKAMDMARLHINGTNMILSGIVLPKNGTINFTIQYHYTLNKGSHNRTGEVEPNAAFVAYFFPRIAVYDDIDGWNKFAYDGGVEFYNDFCHFDAKITVPADFVVWATGDLQNGSDVLAPAVFQKLQQAEKHDDIIYVIDSADLQSGHVTKQDAPTNTWHFQANHVTDFVFATSNHYVWQSSSLVVDPATQRRTRVDAAFNPKHKDYFLVAGDARKTVEAMSYTFPAWPFPYNHETVFDGLDQMEYPMMVNDNPIEDRAESIELTDHEIFHTMFPFYMGINETKYAWMDEGWATIGEWLISPMIDSSLVDLYGVFPTALNAGKETDLPIMTLSNEQRAAYFTNSYPKPAMGYLYIRDYLGDALFTKALHHYIRNWNGKHPMPNDFFYSMNEGAGQNLNWFWKKWFFEVGVPDLAIKNVRKKGKKMEVSIENKTGLPLPVDLQIYYTDGSKEKIHFSIGVWKSGKQYFKLRFTPKSALKKLVLYDAHTPDSYPKDNTYSWE
ncbi:MAG: M1 family metallopeptidase [Chitinophagaceae bacterium]